MGWPDVRRQQQVPTIIVVGRPLEVIQLAFPLLYYFFFMAPAPCSSSCYSKDFGLFNFCRCCWRWLLLLLRLMAVRRADRLASSVWWMSRCGVLLHGRF